ncbi:MAG: RidA family protein [Rectinema sp.]|nr:RidA family protein [Rectinema sp.]
MKSIFAEGAPAALGPYSHAKQAGNVIFLSGQAGLDPATGSLVEGGIEAQTRRTLDNLGIVLKAAGCTFADVVKTTIFLKDMNDFAVVNRVYGEYFSGEYPARSTVQVAGLPKNALVEIEFVAMKA